MRRTFTCPKAHRAGPHQFEKYGHLGAMDFVWGSKNCEKHQVSTLIATTLFQLVLCNRITGSWKYWSGPNRSNRTSSTSPVSSSLCQWSVAASSAPVADLPWVKPHCYCWAERGWCCSRWAIRRFRTCFSRSLLNKVSKDIGWRFPRIRVIMWLGNRWNPFFW